MGLCEADRLNLPPGLIGPHEIDGSIGGYRAIPEEPFEFDPYQRLIRSGELKPGYACDNDAGIYFVDNEVRRVVKTRPEASVYFVDLEAGEVVETELPAEMID
jgi:hypothetical protein